jgi:hypothetical protein
MKILTGGCSFTAHLIEDKLAWPYHLQMQGHEIFNSAEMASGNQIISDRLCWALEKQSYDCCIVMWSNPYRFELFLNKERYDYNQIHNQMKTSSSYTNFFLNGSSSAHSDSNWVRTGGGYGFWKFENKQLDKVMENYLKHHFNYEYQFIQTCKSIVIVQLICEKLGIKLINTCWQNIWDNLYDLNDNMIGSNWLTEHSIKDLKNHQIEYKPIIEKYPNALHWYNMIDWSTWLFYETEYVKRGGLGEFAVIKNNDVLDQSHPSRSSQELWSRFLLENM